MIPLENYFAATLELRDTAKNVEAIARERGLNAKYLGALFQMLAENPPSQLLDELRARWNAALPGETGGMVDFVARWQKKLWKFSGVGHIGKTGGPKAWMEPVFIDDKSEPMQAACEDFRRMFPPALCYTKIVPVDEMVTLTLFHREDDALARLMLDDAQKAKLDRMWSELHFIAQDALTLVDAFEQIWQFSTQDGPNAPNGDQALVPLREPIKQRAETFKKLLVETEPRHVEAVLEFADRAYRRPLTDREKAQLWELYRKLREQELPHEDAIRLTLARVLVGSAFLYKAERQGPGKSQSPVSDWELATRLSYFLWSSAPDAGLREVAAAGKLRDPEVLAAQTRLLRASAKSRGRVASGHA